MLSKRAPLPTATLLLLVAAAIGPAQEQAKPLTLAGHKDKVCAAAWLPDGRVATAGFDRVIRIWDTASGKPQQTLEGPQDVVYALAVGPDGKHIASAGKDRAIRLWDLAAPGAPKELSGHSRAVYHLAFSPDGKLLASCGEDDTRIMLWDVEQAKSVKQLNATDPDDKNQRRSMFCVEFSPDGKQLVSCGADRTIRLWDVAGGKEIRRLEGPEYAVFTEKGKEIERTMKKAGSELAIYAVAFSPDGKLIASGGLDRTIRIWDAGSGQLRQTIAGHPDFVYDVQFNQAGTRLLSCGHNGNLFVWNVADAKQLHTAKLSGPALGATASPDRTRVAAACADGNAYVVGLPLADR